MLVATKQYTSQWRTIFGDIGIKLSVEKDTIKELCKVNVYQCELVDNPHELRNLVIDLTAVPNILKLCKTTGKVNQFVGVGKYI